MQDISINLSTYKLMVTEEPTTKMRRNEHGEDEPVTNRDGELQFVVSLFAKPRRVAGEKTPKGEEITVNLPVDPGEGFEEGSYVELVNPVLNTYAIPDKTDPKKIANAGIWFKAAGLKPAGPGVVSSAA
jgi:hypothetical protein